MDRFIARTRKHDTLLTIFIIFISIVLYWLLKEPALSSGVSEASRAILLLFSGIITTIIWSSADRTRRMTFARLADLIKGADAAGLVRVEPTLQRGTRAEDACRDAKRSIKFIGIGGRKFLTQILEDSDGNDIGRRIASGDVSLEVMLLNPKGEQIGKWTRNEKKLSKVCKDICLTLKELHPIAQGRNNVRCRVYDFMPPLRILIVDFNTVYVSRYDPSSSDGWDAPQLCFVNHPETKSSEFTKSFDHLFSLLWNVGENLELRHFR